jgi:GT2 family glycosyltransferase
VTESQPDTAPELLLICGMHRSGTSLVTNCFQLFGYSLGQTLMEPNEDNPKGFFEDLDVVRLNDELLNENGSSWDAPVFLERQSLSWPSYHMEAALEIIEGKLERFPKLAIKDPRTCLTLPFWREVAKTLGVPLRLCLVYRNPLDIAASIERRNGLPMAEALALIQLYWSELLKQTAPTDVVIDYGAFIADPELVLDAMGDWLEVTPDSTLLPLFLEQFIDPKLQHHAHDWTDLAEHDALPEGLLTAAELLKKRAQGGSISKKIWHSAGLTDPAATRTLLLHQLADRIRKLDALTHRAERLELERAQQRFEMEDIARQKSERESHIELLETRVSETETALLASQAFAEDRASELAQAQRDFTLAEQARLDVEATNIALARLGDEQRIAIETQQEALTNQQLELDSRQQVIDTERQNNLKLIAENQALSTEVAKIPGLEDNIRGLEGHLADFDRIHRDTLNSVSYRLGRALTYPVRKPIVSLVLPSLRDRPRATKFLSFFRLALSHPWQLLRLLSPRRVVNFFKLLFKRPDLTDQVLGNYEHLLQNRPAESKVSVEPFTDEALELVVEDPGCAFPEVESPVLSILIPVYNQLHYTLACLRSIADHPPSVAFEVVVADDCSTDATAAVLARVPGLILVHHDHNLGFLRSCNKALDSCRGEFVFLLNNDTVLTEGSLDALLQTFEAYPKAGIVGARLQYPNGKLQEAGGIVWRDASAWNFGRLQDPTEPAFNYVKPCDYVSGAALMIRRALFLSLGKFDERYAPAYYEDTDLCFGVREAGYEVLLQPRATIIHFEGISHGTDETAGMKQHQVTNRETFATKWQTVLEREHVPNGEQVFLARDRSFNKTTVLIIDHYVPHFDKDAGSRSTFQYIKLLVEAGCNVKFLGDNFYRHEPYTTVLEQMGVEVLVGETMNRSWKQWLKETAATIDVIYLHRPHIASNYIDVINTLKPKPRTLYFGHDLHHLRLEREFALTGDKKVKADAARWHQKEYALFDKVDVVYYPSSVEVDAVKAERPDLAVRVLPLNVFQEPSSGNSSFDTRTGIVFVGGFNHPPNADGLRWFCHEVLPLIMRELPDLVLHIVGSNMPDDILELADEHVIVHGFISDDELVILYSGVRVSVVPLRFGAGVKGKVLEALHAGVPVVTTSVGAEGIPESETLLTIADEAETMASALTALYTNVDRLEALAHAGQRMIANEFSTGAVLAHIREDFLIKP